MDYDNILDLGKIKQSSNYSKYDQIMFSRWKQEILNIPEIDKIDI